MDPGSGGYRESQLEYDRHLAELEQERNQAEWLAALEADRAIQVALAPPVTPPPKKKRPPKGSTPRAKARLAWRRRAERGLPGRCTVCRRTSIAPKTLLLCNTCYYRLSGHTRRDSRRRLEKILAWRREHRDRVRAWDRKYQHTAAAKRKRNARRRRQRRKKKAERLRLLREKLHQERQAFRTGG